MSSPVEWTDADEKALARLGELLGAPPDRTVRWYWTKEWLRTLHGEAVQELAWRVERALAERKAP